MEQGNDSASSVRVSWDRIDAAGITGYVVYHGSAFGVGSNENVTVPSTENSVLITGLMTNVQYQFQVVTMAEFRGVQFVGDRSEGSTVLTSLCDVCSTCEESSHEGIACIMYRFTNRASIKSIFFVLYR